MREGKDAEVDWKTVGPQVKPELLSLIQMKFAKNVLSHFLVSMILGIAYVGYLVV